MIIVRGGADKSYGIEVAKLAGLPEEVLRNGKKILRSLEERKAIIEKKIEATQLSLFSSLKEQEVAIKQEEKSEEIEIIYQLQEMDINNMTPLEALNKLAEIKKMLKN